MRRRRRAPRREGADAPGAQGARTRGRASAWLPLSPGGRDGENAHLVARRGVLVSTADAFSTATLAPDALRLALGAPPWTDLVAAPAVVRGTVAG
ncbi:hypothetical protein [Actinoalloteichus caeruleus]|uniref:hypothetical protein n=1 Tax=Actinoalloteichus cyanogriseus TaxID=2893586 RepID=UPI003AD6F45A